MSSESGEDKQTHGDRGAYFDALRDVATKSLSDFKFDGFEELAKEIREADESVEEDEVLLRSISENAVARGIKIGRLIEKGNPGNDPSIDLMARYDPALAEYIDGDRLDEGVEADKGFGDD